MVQLILHDFFRNSLHSQTPPMVDQQMLMPMMNSLKNIWKIESDKVLLYWKQADDHLVELKTHHKKKFPKYYKLPAQFSDNELIVWHWLPLIRFTEMFQQISQRLRDKFEIACRAVAQFGFFYSFLNQDLKRNVKICILAVGSYPLIYEKIDSELKFDRQIVLRALKSKLSIKIPNELMNDKEVMKFYIRNISEDSSYLELSKEILDDRQLALEVIKKGSKKVKFVSERLQHDCSFFFQAVHHNYFSYTGFPKDLRENREFVKRLIPLNLPIFVLSEEFRKDEEIIRLFISKNVTSIKYVHYSVLTKPYLLSLLGKRTYIPFDFLQLIPPHFLSDMDIVKAAAQLNSLSYACLKPEQKTRQVTEWFLSVDRPNYCLADELPPELMKDRDLVIKCLQKEGCIIQSTPSMYLKDREVVKITLSSALKNPGPESVYIVAFLDRSLANDREFMMKLLEEMPGLAKIRYYDWDEFKLLI